MISATITLNPSSTVSKDKEVMALLTISNDDTMNEVTISQIRPLLTVDSDNSTLQEFIVPPNFIVPVATVDMMVTTPGTASVTFPLAFHSPFEFSVGALVYSMDGQVVAATPASITVTNF